MGRVWSTWLVVLAFSHSGTTLETSYLEKILSDPIPTKNNFAEGLLSIIRDPSLDFMVNIGIDIQAESNFSRQEFTDTVERFISSNDRVTMYLGSVEGKNVHLRIYFVDSLKLLEFLIKRHREVDNDFSAERQYYLIILPVYEKEPKRLMKQIFHLCWNESIINVDILVGDKYGVVSLYTYFPFTAKSCADHTPIIHNRFTNGGFESNRPIFPSKTKNLWQCPVRSALFTLPGYVVLKPAQVLGFETEALMTLAETMNFSYSGLISPEGRGDFYSNTSSTGAFKMLKDGLVDFLLVVSTETILNNFGITNMFHAVQLRLIIKRSKPYGPLEILLLPFDRYTWIVISILSAVKWVVHLFWRRFCSRSVAPSESFMHFSTMLWLFTMLILSSSYEGSVFKFLHSPPNKALPKSIDEAIDQDYKFVTSSFNMPYLRQIPELNNRIILYGDSEFETIKFFDRLEGKYGYTLWENFIPQYIDAARFEEYYVAPVRIVSCSVLFHMRKFSYLTVEFNKQLQHLHAHGHYLKSVRAFGPQFQHQKKKVHKRPESMSLQHLSGAFQIFSILIVISGCVFAMELLATYNPRLRAILEVFQ